MLPKIFLITSLLLLTALTAQAWSLTETFRVGPVYTGKPGEVSAVVELPAGAAPIASDFSLVIDRKPVAVAREVRAFEESGKGLSIVFCVDVSGSMKHGPLVETKNALLSFLGTAERRPEDRISLISFADEVRIESSFAKSREQLADAVVRLRTRGRRTRLYHALYTALTTFEGVDLPARRRVIIISDGKDEGSTETLENVTTKSNALAVPVDAIGRGRIDRRHLQVLSGLTESSGGQFVEARPDVLSLSDAISRIYRDLLETRSVVVYFSFEPVKSGAKTRNAKIELRRLGGNALSAPIPGEIPQASAERTAAPAVARKWPFDIPVLILVPLIGLVAITTFILIWLNRSRKGSGEQIVKQAEENRDTGLEQAMEREYPDILESPPKTEVGACYYPFPSPGRPAALLAGVGGPLSGLRYGVDKELFRIGADPGNDLCIIGDEYVSANHAYLRYEEGSLFVFDDGSLNGTFVNQERVARTAVPIMPGDRIQVGNSLFELVASPR